MKDSPQGNSLASSDESDDVILVTAPSTESLSNPPTRNMGQLSLDNLGVLKAVPWYFDSTRVCSFDPNVGATKNLEKLMRIYQRQIFSNVRECYSRPNRAVKLKKNMADTIMFFHLMCSDYKSPLEHSSYLAKMSDLMAMYMDMEIKASRTGIESLPKIASKLTSSMHVYFGNNYDLILDTVLKAKMISANYWELCDLIFRRVLRDSPGSGSSVYIVSYIRYLLAFKMWKCIVKGKEERKQIVRLAMLKLQPPPDFREKMSNAGYLRDVLPRLPKSQTDITAFYMQAKFHVKDKSKIFLKAVEDPKLQSPLDSQPFSSNDSLSINDLQDESEIIIRDIWTPPPMSLLEDGLFDDCHPVSPLSRMDTAKYKMKCLGKSKLDQIKRKRKRMELFVDEEIGEDDLPISCDNEERTSCIKKEEVPDKEPEDPVNDIHINGDTMEIAAEIELSSNSNLDNDTLIKIEPHITNPDDAAVYQALWNDPNFEQYYNNVDYDLSTNTKDTEYVIPEEVVTLNTVANNIIIPEDQGASVKETVIEKVEDDVDKLAMKDFEAIEPSQFQEQVLDQDFKELDYKFADMFNNYEVSIDKPPLVMKETNNSLDYSVDESGLNVNNMVHSSTVKSDSKMYDFQKKIYSYAGKFTSRTWFNFLSPIFCEQSQVKRYRCYCSPCKSNLNIIRRNWKNVMARIMLNDDKIETMISTSDKEGYTYDSSLEDLKAIAEGEKGDVMYCENEIDDLLKKIDESIKEDSESSTLPLKKRKAFSYNNENSYVTDYVTETKENDVTEMSYPSTPMISIAELLKEETRLNPGGVANNTIAPNMPPPSTYLPSSNQYFFPYPMPEIVIQSANKAIPLSKQNILPGTYNQTPFLPKHQEQKVKFKTPAQLKEFQQFNSVQGLMNFANTTGKVPPDQNPVPGAYTTTFLPEHRDENLMKLETPNDYPPIKASELVQKMIFTPAQLKELQQLAAAEDLINFAHASRTYTKAQEPAPERQSRKKKTSRKRKRI